MPLTAGVSLIQDGRAYAYAYWKRFSTLYEVKNAPRLTLLVVTRLVW